MQIILNSQQSQILQSLAQQGGYVSLEETIDTALALLADEIVQQNSDPTPEYLAWVEQTRLKIEQGIQAAERGDVLDVEEVLARLRNKVETARSTSMINSCSSLFKGG